MFTGPNSKSMTWTVDDIVGMGSKGDHRYAAVATCDDNTRITGAVGGTYLQGMWSSFGGGVRPSECMVFGDFEQRERESMNDGEYLFFHFRHDTDVGVINDHNPGRIWGSGPTIDQYIDAHKEDVFEYSEGRLAGNHTKGTIGSWSAYSLSVTWEGHGYCRISLEDFG